MSENNKEQGELLAKLAAVGLGAIVGGAIGGPIGAAVGAATALGLEELRLAENLPKPKPPNPQPGSPVWLC